MQPVDPAVQIAVSHAEFLLVQARQIVNQLAGTKTLDPLLCRQMQSLLDQAQVRPPPTPKRDIAQGQVVKKDPKKDVKGKNKWAREVMADTPLLPTLVDTALSATAGPFLSSAQREAIVDIVASHKIVLQMHSQIQSDKRLHNVGRKPLLNQRTKASKVVWQAQVRIGTSGT